MAFGGLITPGHWVCPSCSITRLWPSIHNHHWQLMSCDTRPGMRTSPAYNRLAGLESARFWTRKTVCAFSSNTFFLRTTWKSVRHLYLWTTWFMLNEVFNCSEWYLVHRLSPNCACNSVFFHYNSGCQSGGLKLAPFSDEFNNYAVISSH